MSNLRRGGLQICTSSPLERKSSSSSCCCCLTLKGMPVFSGERLDYLWKSIWISISREILTLIFKILCKAYAIPEDMQKCQNYEKLSLNTMECTLKAETWVQILTPIVGIDHVNTKPLISKYMNCFIAAQLSKCCNKELSTRLSMY